MGLARPIRLLPLLPPLDTRQKQRPIPVLPCPDDLSPPPPIERPPGRDDLINRAIVHLRPMGPIRASSAVVIFWGAPGLGKRTLAQWLVQFYQSYYPDACLRAKLRPGTSAWSRGLVLRRWLHQLGEDPSIAPAGLTELEARWQTCLRDRKAIVWLETDCPPDQWRPLIPKSSSCMALVTTPYPPPELLECLSLAVRPLPLDQAAPWEGIPLALRLAGVVIQQHQSGGNPGPPPDWAKDWRPQPQIHPKYPAIAGSFSLVYHQLSAPAQALLRRLALLPVPLLSSSLATVLLAQDQPAQAVIDELVTHQCLESIGPDAYCPSHDLIRLLAKNYLAGEDTISTRQQLRLAIGQWYAEALLQLGWSRHPSWALQPDLASAEPPSSGTCQPGWIEYHWPNLTQIWEWLQQEEDWSGLLRLGLGLSSALEDPGIRDWGWPYLSQLLSTEPDQLDQQLLAYLRNNLANGLVYRGQIEEAMGLYHQSLEMLRIEQDRMGQVQVLANLGNGYRLQQVTERHLQCWRQALEMLPGDDRCRPALQNWMLELHKDIAQIALLETGTSLEEPGSPDRSWPQWMRNLFR